MPAFYATLQLSAYFVRPNTTRIVPIYVNRALWVAAHVKVQITVRVARLDTIMLPTVVSYVLGYARLAMVVLHSVFLA
jgi:hypothetical protein